MIQQEGDDTNCFVSLVVDTRGTYVAVITRKIQTKSEVIIKNLGKSYEFFGEGSKEISKDDTQTTKIVDREVIEYFDLQVERHEVPNTLDYLDTRFEEINKKKEEERKAQRKATELPLDKYPLFRNSTDNELTDFEDWFKKRHFQNDDYEPNLFEKPSTKSLDVLKPTKKGTKKDWRPNEEKVHQAAVKIILGAVIATPQKVDLKQWVTKFMNKKYNEVFGDPYEGTLNSFQEWKDFIIQYTLDYFDDDVPDSILADHAELFYSRVAQAIFDELNELSEDNPYMNEYCDLLLTYVIE